jgi:hypothetical protein
MQRRNKIAVGIFAVFYISFGTWLTLNQERIVYQPGTRDFASCPAFLSAEKVTHNGTRMYVSGTDLPVAVLYHGNAGSACDRAGYAQLFAETGYDYIIVEYAGYGGDARTPTHTLIKQDARNVIDWLEQNNITNITLVGESIGGGVAAYHTSLAPPAKLLLITPFTDLAAVASQRFWFYPTSLLVENAYDNVTNLATYPGPTHIIHGKEDQLIPYSLGRELYDSLSGDKTFVSIENAGHNNLFAAPETFEAIEEFLIRE